jgi:hypothetical protein
MYKKMLARVDVLILYALHRRPQKSDAACAAVMKRQHTQARRPKMPMWAKYTCFWCASEEGSP